MSMEARRARLLADRKLYPPDQLGDEADPDHLFGDVEGVPMFATFADRRECAAKGVHRPIQAGIWGSGEHGAYSIVMSGGYEDDVDEGYKITYTGTGGRDSASAAGKQVRHQDREYRDNAALFTSAATGKSVRVVRGGTEDPKNVWAPRQGFRYDGLYVVKSAEEVVGKSKLLICKFVLERHPGQKALVPRSTIAKAGGA